MKILHLLSQHPESTGSGFYLQNLIRQAAAAGHRNFLVAGMTAERVPFVPGIDPEHCRFVRFGEGELKFAVPGMSNVMPYPSSRFDELSAEQIAAYEKVFTETIRDAVEEFSPDILHSHHLWLASAVARSILPEIPMVTSCHSTDLRQFVQCPHLRQRVLPGCLKIDRVMALSQDQRDKIGEIYGINNQRIDIVGGGYDKELFFPGKKPQPPPVHLLYAGKLSLAKGVDWLLRTFISLAEPGLHLHLAGSGSGEEGQLCVQLAKEAGSQVTIHGRINQRELAQLMGLCHIFILPSFYEGLPLVLLEALASGCRIIATDLPGCRDLLAKAGPDLVHFVNLPVLSTIDRPDPKDWQILHIGLAEAIDDMAARVRMTPSPALAEILEITSPFSWQEVFARIVQSYEKAMVA